MPNLQHHFYIPMNYRHSQLSILRGSGDGAFRLVKVK
jgi:hypothetical protein